MVRARAPNSVREKWYHNLLGHANTDHRSGDKGQQIRHHHQEQKRKSCLLIDMSILTDWNTSVKVTEKLSKYKDLEIEIERMWGMKATTVPVVIGALGLVKKGMEKYTPKKIRPERQNTRTTEDHTTWNLSHPRKGTIH